MSDARKNGMAPLLLSIRRLEREHAEIQKAHEAAQDWNQTLRRDNLDVKLTIRRLSTQIQQFYLEREELNEMRKALANDSDNLTMLQSRLKALEAQNSNFHDELESSLGELTTLRRQREADKEQIRNLSTFLSTLEYQNALGQNCVQEEEDSMRRRDAVLNELNSAIKERSKLVEEWTARKAQLKIEITEAAEDTPTTLSIFEELRLCKDQVQEALPTTSQIVPADMQPKWRISAHLNQLIRTVSFAITLLFMFLMISTSVPVCQPGAGVPCEDLLRDALQSVVLPYCNIHFRGAPPF